MRDDGQYWDIYSAALMMKGSYLCKLGRTFFKNSGLKSHCCLLALHLGQWNRRLLIIFAYIVHNYATTKLLIFSKYWHYFYCKSRWEYSYFTTRVIILICNFGQAKGFAIFSNIWSLFIAIWIKTGSLMVSPSTLDCI